MSVPSVLDLYTREENESLVSINSAVPIHLKSVAPTTKDLRLFADLVIVRGTIIARGRRISIVCRELHCEQSATIDVSGHEPLISFRPGSKKPVPTVPGEGGAPGDSGSDGEPAGSITIFAAKQTGELQLLANGGAGGRGQDGGDGSVGVVGPEGPLPPCDRTGDIRGLQGGQGGKGGRAGLAGRSGNGGPGGGILARIGINEGRIVGETRGGEPGQIASHGSPGRGGLGGPGSIDRIGSRVPDYNILNYNPLNDVTARSEAIKALVAGGSDSDEILRLVDGLLVARVIGNGAPPLLDKAQGAQGFNTESVSISTLLKVLREPTREPPTRTRLECTANGWHTRGPVGPEGPGGDPETAAIHAPTAGTAGVADIQTAQWSIVTNEILPFCRMLQIIGEEEYRSGEEGYARAAVHLTFLLALIDDSASAATQLFLAALGQTPPSGIGQTALKEFRARAAMLLHQMTLGLDFFGYPRDYVPHLVVHEFDLAIRALLEAGRAVEISLRDFRSADANENIRRRALQQTIDQIDGLQISTWDQIAKLDQDARKLGDEISAMQIELELQKRGLLEAQSNLKSALESAAGRGCEFIEVITVIGSVAAIASGAYAALGTFQAALTAASTSDTLSDFATGLAQLEVVGKNLNDIQQKWQTVKARLQQDPDSVKLAILADDVDTEQRRILDELQKIPRSEAREFETRLKRFAETSQMRNAKVIELTSMLAGRQRLAQEYKQRLLELGQVRDALSASGDPTRSMALNFLEGAYRQIRGRAVELITLELRSFEYITFREQVRAIHGWSIDALGVAQASLVADITAEKSRRVTSA